MSPCWSFWEHATWGTKSLVNGGRSLNPTSIPAVLPFATDRRKRSQLGARHLHATDMVYIRRQLENNPTRPSPQTRKQRERERERENTTSNTPQHQNCRILASSNHRGAREQTPSTGESPSPRTAQQRPEASADTTMATKHSNHNSRTHGHLYEETCDWWQPPWSYR